MTTISILGVPHDANSSFVRGPAEAPPLIRAELWSDAANTWTETRVDLGVTGQVRDLGDITFDGSRDDWGLIEEHAARGLEGGPLIALGGDHAVRRQHPRLTILHIDAHPDIYHDFQGNPRCDIAGMTATVAAKLVREIAGVMAKTAQARDG